MRHLILISALILALRPPTLAQGTHWAFKKPARAAIPAVKQASWVRNPIDSFILSALERKGLSPSPPADKRTLLRRVTFDLTGLPPTPEEIAAFVEDRSSDAYEKVVRRLLASPRYGERWAQHWLDVVRFGETSGYEHDDIRPQSWRYRDYVVNSLNADKPFDRFILEQVAGDELAPDDFEMRVATGFLRAGPQHVNPGNQDTAENRQEWLTEAVAGVGNGILGLTIGCARCHDHKYDPIPQADFYRLQAFFSASDNTEYKRVSPEDQKAYDAAVKAYKEKLKPIEAQIAVIEKPYRERLREEKRHRLAPEFTAALAVEDKKRTPEQKMLASDAQVQLVVSWDEVLAVLTLQDRVKRTELRTQLHAVEREEPTPPAAALSVADTLQPTPAMHLLLRGDPHTPGPEVQPGFPGCMSQIENIPSSVIGHPSGIRDAKIENQISKIVNSTGRRTQLANWLVSADNPLTARIIANRLWHYHFGRGIVATPNDFGLNGKSPTHPELLDWLANELVKPSQLVNSSVGQLKPPAGGQIDQLTSLPIDPTKPWSLKRLHYLILTSNAYRQSSDFYAGKAKIDPENKLVWRMNRRRLDAEALRDAALQAAGKLNIEMGGPPILVPLDPEVYDTLFSESEPDNLWPVAPAQQHGRRSLYLLRKRNVRLPMLALFDQPDMMSSCAARGQTVHALQALTLINSDFMLQQARALARRLLTKSPGEEQRINRLYTITLGRSPQPREHEATSRFLREQTRLIRARIADGERILRVPNLPSGADPAQAAAWADLCLATLNLNEFVYVR